jgi:hypothetical protein
MHGHWFRIRAEGDGGQAVTRYDVVERFRMQGVPRFGRARWDLFCDE